jgi:hypothetical protein
LENLLNYILGLSLLLLHIGRLEDKLHQIYNKKDCRINYL